MATCETLIALLETLARLNKLDLDVNNGLAESPKARTALYNDPIGETYRKLVAKDKSVFHDACVGLGGVFEYYLLIRNDIQYLPNSNDIIQSWNGYMKTAFQNSCGFRENIRTNQNARTPMLLEELRNDATGLEFPRDNQ